MNANSAICAALSRRRFLQSILAGSAGIALSGTVSTRIAMAADPSYTGDVIVVLSLRGGFDGLNAIVPAGDPDYLVARPNIGIPSNALLGLDSMFGLHPALAPLLPFWQSGQFGAVHAVGQPAPTRSHFEATEEMERAAPDSSIRTGWLDRALGLRSVGPVFQAVQLGDSLPTLALTGPTPELALGSLADFHLAGMGPDDDQAWAAPELARWTEALSAMHEDAPASIADPVDTALGAVKAVTAMTTSTYIPAVPYPDNDLARALTDAARLIKAGIGVQVVCLDFDGWDMHGGMGTFSQADSWLTTQLRDLSASLAAFATDLGGRFDRTTIVTMSEFGRRVEENDSGGVDHGHGNAMLLLGGKVNGGQVHGRWPGLGADKLYDGDLAGVTDFRLVLAEIMRKRCGQTGLSQVFPGADLQTELGVVRT